MTKRRVLQDGRIRGGKPFSRGNLYQLLSNPLYVGEIPHKGQTYPGLHEPIVDRQLWDAVQAAMSTNTVERRASANVNSPSILTGLGFDETGDRLSPSHAIKAGVRYRYYVSHRLMNARKVDSTSWRLPAGELERPILAALSRRLGDEQELMQLLKLDGLPSHVHQTINVSGTHLADKLQTASAAARKKLLHSFVMRIEIHPDRLSIAISIPKLTALLNGPIAIPDDADAEDSIATFDLPHRLKRRGVEAKLVVGNGRDREPNSDNALISLIAQAHHWLDSLTSGEVASIADLAVHENADRNEISRFLPPAFLAPGIIEKILIGTQPVDLTVEKLRRLGALPHAWDQQRAILGFTD